MLAEPRPKLGFGFGHETEAEAETEALAELTGTSQQDEASFETDFDAEVEAIKNKLATPSY